MFCALPLVNALMPQFQCCSLSTCKLQNSIGCHPQDAALAGTWALRVAELHEALDASPPAGSQLIAAVLAPRHGWPQFAAPGEAALPSDSSPASDGQAGMGSAAGALDALAAALAARLGAAAVFSVSDGEHR